MKPNVFIIILNWNGKENTIECLESVKKLKVDKQSLRPEGLDEELRIVVVDNGSTDGSASQISNLKSQISNLTLIENKENLGFAGGNNVGIRYALEHGADYILILNNDTIVDKSLIDELLAVAKLNDSVGVVAPKIYFAKGFEFHKDRYKESERRKVIWYAGGVMDFRNVLGHHKGVDEVDKGQFDEVDTVDFASGCALFIKREVLEKVGMFDEKYFLYYEDSDLAERVKKTGYKIMYAPKAMLWHKNAGSAGGSGSSLQDYYITRNRLLFGMRYAPLQAKLALLRESTRLLTVGRTWQKRGVLDFYLGRWGKGSYLI